MARTRLLIALFLAGCPASPSAPDAATAAPELHAVALPRRAAGAPIQLHASDPLPLTKLTATATLGADSASTELTIEFPATPPGARLSLALPRLASVRTLAARTNAWHPAAATQAAPIPQPAAPIPQPAAPIPQPERRLSTFLPPGTRAVRLAYTEPFESSYRLALRGLPPDLVVEARIAGSTVALARPDRDLERSLPVAPAAPPPLASVLILVDTSASAAADFERNIALLRALLDALPAARVQLVLFDQDLEHLYEGPLSGMPRELWQRALTRGAFGASNLGRALSQLVVRQPFERALLVSDGLITAGPTDHATLVASVKRLSSATVKRLDVLASGAVRDDALLAALAASQAEPGSIIDADLPLPEIARRLTAPGVSTPPPARLPDPSFYLPFAGQPALQRGDPQPGSPHQARYAELVPRERQQAGVALENALAWHREAPFDALPLLALGDLYAALHQNFDAARAFGSLIDLHPSDPDLRQLAASRLEMIRDEGSIRLALDSFEKAVVLAPERPWSHRLLAWAMVKAHQEPLAFVVLERAAQQVAFGPAQAILREDASIVAAAWIKKEPRSRAEITRRLIPLGVTVATQPSLWLSLYGPASVDVDLRVRDRKGELPAVAPSPGAEVIAVRREPQGRGYPYRAEALVHGLGPLGMTAGKLEIAEHDGKGNLWFLGRSFVLTRANGVADLGTIDKPLGKGRGR